MTRKNANMYMKGSASAQIIYHCSISPESISGIVIYIFTTGKDRHMEYQPVHFIVNDRGLFTAGWFGVREKYWSSL